MKLAKAGQLKTIMLAVMVLAFGDFGQRVDAQLIPAFNAHLKGIAMNAGREARVPVSDFYRSRLSVADSLSVRTRCAGQDDTGMLVRLWRANVIDIGITAGNASASATAQQPPDTPTTADGKILHNDDDRISAGARRGSRICIQCENNFGANRAEIIVFSQKRETAYCTLEGWDGRRWKSLTQPRYRHYGGTVLNVGPMRPGDYVGVKTRNLSASTGFDARDYDTEMVLFNPNVSAGPLLYNDNYNGSRDPRITVTREHWLDRSNFVLLGKSKPHSNSNKGVEVNVDVIRGPLDDDLSSHYFGTSTVLTPGRYYVWLYAKTSSPVGSPVPEPHRASSMNTNSNGFICPGKPGEFVILNKNRGTLNGRAFDFRLVSLDGSVFKTLKNRRILKGQLGAAANALNLFLIEIEIEHDTKVALEVSDVSPEVEFFPQWRVMRNADASELTVASFNTLYDNDSPHLPKTRNASNLLASRGEIRRVDRSIRIRSDQAASEWDADIIGLQELRAGSDDGRHEDYYANEFAAEAHRRGSRSFEWVRGKDENYPFGVDGRGPLYLSEQLWPNGRAQNIFVPRRTLRAAGCNTHSATTNYECNLHGAGTFRATYALPAFAKVARHRVTTASGRIQNDRPITVVNLHLRDGSRQWINRIGQMEDLLKKLKIIQQQQPSKFNAAGDTSRLHYQNRIILMGDFNWSAHHCGEHYWILKKLRDTYGYAIDVSMASDNDMHDRQGAIGANGVPVGWTSAKTWADGRGGFNSYPWWMATYRGKDPEIRKGRSDRYDAILLVGRGWAYDDPVRDYEVQWDRIGTSLMTGRRSGVEMSIKGDLTGRVGYRPRHNLVNPGRPTRNGDPALDSDHIPVRTKLRLFVR